MSPAVDRIPPFQNVGDGRSHTNFCRMGSQAFKTASDRAEPRGLLRAKSCNGGSDPYSASSVFGS